ncbi:MAG TPA: hypothetical protein VEL07_20825 [Planctomycetota bacterium]|nr:hypothetical protein [Planctomycetota bacterium]
MLSRLVPCLTILTAIAAAPAAEGYQFELTLGYTGSETDQSDVEETSIYLDAAYFFEEVALGEAPNEEADFLGHHSYIAGYSTMPWQSSERRLIASENYEAGAIDADGITYGVSGQYAAADIPVTAGAGVYLGTIEDDDVDVEFEPMNWTVNVGYWVLPNAVVGVRYTSQEVETTIATLSSEIESSTIDVFGKGVHRFDNDQSVNVEASVGQQTDDDGSEDEDSWVGNLAVDWYPVDRYGIGLLVGALQGDNDAEEGFTYGARASGWFTDNIGMRVGLSQFSVDDSDLGEDNTSWYIELAGRF